VALKRIVVARGFISAEIRQESCDRWSVVVGGIKSGKTAKDFAAEARSAGFTVTFESS
jgi:D-arabinose 5-phosphate isomerase GutQ